MSHREVMLLAMGLNLALTVTGPIARAGIADSPLPVLVPGKPTIHVYSVPSIIDQGGGLSSFFGCTSTDTAAMQVGVELFGPGGGGPANDAVASSLAVAPGATVVFGTGSAAGILINSNLGGFGTASARILATSKKLACTAFVADKFNDPPTSMVYLTIVSKLKQRGE